MNVTLGYGNLTGSNAVPGFTRIDKTNPASAACTLDSVSARSNGGSAGHVKIGTFNPTTLVVHDYAGEFGIGDYWQTITGLAIECDEGDLLGIYYTTGGGIVGNDNIGDGLYVALCDGFDGNSHSYDDISSGATGMSASGEAPTIISLTDSGAGSDSLQIGVGISLADSGEGFDSLVGDGIAALISLLESGAGADEVGNIKVSLSVPDSGIGEDQIALIAAVLALADSGAGEDVVVRYILKNNKTVEITFTPKTANINFTQGDS